MTRDEKIEYLRQMDRAEKIKLLEDADREDADFGITDYLAPIARGATLGYGDEISAGIAATIAAASGDIPEGQGWGDAYSDIHKSIKGRQDKFDELNKGYSTGADIVGGMLMPGGLLKQAANKGLKQTIGTGMAEGAIAGAGYADEGERLQGAAIGGLIGGAAAPIVKVGTDAMASLPTKAAQRFNRTMDADGITPQQLEQRLIQGDMPLDLGPNFTAQAAAAHQAGGKGMSIIDEAVYGRQREMQDTVEDSLKRQTGADLSFHKTLQEIGEIKKADASDLYGKANSHLVTPTPDMEDFLLNENNKKVIKRAYNEFDPTGTVPLDQASGTLKFWNEVKKSMDDETTKSFRTGLNNKGYSLKGQKNNLVNELDAQSNGDYKKALGAYAGASAQEEALLLGKKSLNADADEIKQMLRGYGADEKEMFINGMARSIRDKVMANPETANAARNLVKSPLFKERMRNAFPSEKAFNEFVKEMDQLARQGESYAKITGGSRTAQNQNIMSETESDINSLASMFNMAVSPETIAPQMFSKYTSRFRGMNEPDAEQFAGLLTERNPGRLASLLDSARGGNDFNRASGGAITGLMSLLNQ